MMLHSGGFSMEHYQSSSVAMPQYHYMGILHNLPRLETKMLDASHAPKARTQDEPLDLSVKLDGPSKKSGDTPLDLSAKTDNELSKRQGDNDVRIVGIKAAAPSRGSLPQTVSAGFTQQFDRAAYINTNGHTHPYYEHIRDSRVAKSDNRALTKIVHSAPLGRDSSKMIGNDSAVRCDARASVSRADHSRPSSATPAPDPRLSHYRPPPMHGIRSVHRGASSHNNQFGTCGGVMISNSSAVQSGMGNIYSTISYSSACTNSQSRAHYDSAGLKTHYQPPHARHMLPNGIHFENNFPMAKIKHPSITHGTGQVAKGTSGTTVRSRDNSPRPSTAAPIYPSASRCKDTNSSQGSFKSNMTFCASSQSMPTKSRDITSQKSLAERRQALPSVWSNHVVSEKKGRERDLPPKLEKGANVKGSVDSEKSLSSRPRSPEMPVLSPHEKPDTPVFQFAVPEAHDNGDRRVRRDRADKETKNPGSSLVHSDKLLESTSHVPNGMYVPSRRITSFPENQHPKYRMKNYENGPESIENHRELAQNMTHWEHNGPKRAATTHKTVAMAPYGGHTNITQSHGRASLYYSPRWPVPHGINMRLPSVGSNVPGPQLRPSSFYANARPSPCSNVRQILSEQVRARDVRTAETAYPLSQSLPHPNPQPQPQSLPTPHAHPNLTQAAVAEKLPSGDHQAKTAPASETNTCISQPKFTHPKKFLLSKSMRDARKKEEETTTKVLQDGGRQREEISSLPVPQLKTGVSQDALKSVKVQSADTLSGGVMHTMDMPIAKRNGLYRLYEANMKGSSITITDRMKHIPVANVNPLIIRTSRESTHFPQKSIDSHFYDVSKYNQAAQSVTQRTIENRKYFSPEGHRDCLQSIKEKRQSLPMEANKFQGDRHSIANISPLDKSGSENAQSRTVQISPYVPAAEHLTKELVTSSQGRQRGGVHGKWDFDCQEKTYYGDAPLKPLKKRSSPTFFSQPNGSSLVTCDQLSSQGASRNDMDFFSSGRSPVGIAEEKVAEPHTLKSDSGEESDAASDATIDYYDGANDETTKQKCFSKKRPVEDIDATDGEDDGDVAKTRPKKRARGRSQKRKNEIKQPKAKTPKAKATTTKCVKVKRSARVQARKREIRKSIIRTRSAHAAALSKRATKRKTNGYFDYDDDVDIYRKVFKTVKPKVSARAKRRKLSVTKQETTKEKPVHEQQRQKKKKLSSRSRNYLVIRQKWYSSKKKLHRNLLGQKGLTAKAKLESNLHDQHLFLGGENEIDAVPKGSSSTQAEAKKLIICKDTGETVLHKAARLGYEEMVRFCLDDGYDVNVRDNAGYTPLHECSVRGHESIARLLIGYGADVNASGNGGIRPIHDAIENDHIQLARLLLSSGADPKLVTYAGKTPQKIAHTARMKAFLIGHLADLNGSAEEDEDPVPWEFQGSTIFSDSDKQTGFDVFIDLPPDEPDEDLIEFDWCDEPVLQTYSLCIDKKKRNYVLLSDMMKKLNIDKKECLQVYGNLHVTQISVHDFRSQIQSTEHHFSVYSVALKTEDDRSDTAVELVLMDNNARSLLNVCTDHVGFHDKGLNSLEPKRIGKATIIGDNRYSQNADVTSGLLEDYQSMAVRDDVGTNRCEVRLCDIEKCRRSTVVTPPRYLRDCVCYMSPSRFRPFTITEDNKENLISKAKPLIEHRDIQAQVRHDGLPGSDETFHRVVRSPRSYVEVPRGEGRSKERRDSVEAAYRQSVVSNLEKNGCLPRTVEATVVTYNGHIQPCDEAIDISRRRASFESPIIV